MQSLFTSTEKRHCCDTQVQSKSYSLYAQEFIAKIFCKNSQPNFNLHEDKSIPVVITKENLSGALFNQLEHTNQTSTKTINACDSLNTYKPVIANLSCQENAKIKKTN
ncbi:hypothetical protein COBT_001964 [Conglomerata obtusa]